MNYDANERTLSKAKHALRYMHHQVMHDLDAPEQLTDQEIAAVKGVISAINTYRKLIQEEINK